MPDFKSQFMQDFTCPEGWKEIDSPLPEQRAFKNFMELRVLSGILFIADSNWLHVSCSHSNRLPSWKELKEVKNKFIGINRKAIQIFPKQASFVNFMPYCFHLWSNLDTDIIPDFESVTGII